MSQINMPESNITMQELAQGDKRLKRVALMITRSTDPERTFPGYALVNELNEKMFYFFCTDKFKIDEELNVQFTVAKQEAELHVVVSSLHEQISSGRIMTSIPTPENPFPARKFYRCFAKVLTHNMHSKEEMDEQLDELDALVETHIEADGTPASETDNDLVQAPAAEALEAAPLEAAPKPAASGAPKLSIAPAPSGPVDPFAGAPVPTEDPELIPKAA